MCGEGGGVSEITIQVRPKCKPYGRHVRDDIVIARGGGALNKVLYGEAPPRGPTPYPFVYHF